MENQNQQATPHQLALVYRLLKNWSVIPVGKNKRPLINWKDFQTRLATPEEINSWWQLYPDAQVGIVTGKISDLTVIDVESDGDFNLIQGETYTIETGGKGRHYYFKFDPRFKNAVRILPSVDVRSEGGYVVAPGSKTEKGPYSVLKEILPIEMPLATQKMLLTQKKRELPWYASSGQSDFPVISTSGLDYDGSGEGGRNDAMTKFAGSIHAKLHPSLWASIGWKMFEDANQKNIPPLPAYELRVIWNSIGSREVQQHPGGRSYTPSVSGNKTWGPTPPEQKKDFSHRYEDSISDDSQVESDSEIADTLHVSEVASLQAIDSDKTFPLDMKPFDEALLGGFSAGELIVVAGQSGHGKTTLIQDWSVTLSSGGVDGSREKLPSLWFSYEVLAKPLWQKFETMGATAETPIYMPKFNETGDIEWVTSVIESAIEKWNIRVVCIDHLGFLRAPKGNYSNAADAVTNTVRALKKLSVKHGLIILLPVHVRKTLSKIPDLNDIRDSLGIAQEADTVFFIAREKDTTGLPTQKAKVFLVKNRKSGISVSASLDFQFGRYFYNENGLSKIADPSGESPLVKSRIPTWAD